MALLVAVATSAASARADALSAVQVLREGGCGGVQPLARPLRHNRSLDQLAREWAAGEPLASAAKLRGYAAGSAEGVHVSGPDAGLLERLRRSECRTLAQQDLREAGLYRRGQDNWLVLVSYTALPPKPQAPWAPPARSQPAPAPPPVTLDAPAPVRATRALELVNAARARSTRCGARQFAPAAPLALSGPLNGVAFGHALDMASHNYFEHQDLTGQSPADRVRAAGYREKLVGENIAYGPQTVEEVVQGWLDSPEHCENIMDARFAEMGIATAAGRTARRGLYWVQLFAAPRA